jgi:hypothetical protein
VKKRTAKIFYRALSDAAHGKGASPCKMLPCALCRAPRQKTHGKGFAVRFKAFAVRSGRTAKPLFPVVTRDALKQRCMLTYNLFIHALCHKPGRAVRTRSLTLSCPSTSVLGCRCPSQFPVATTCELANCDRHAR